MNILIGCEESGVVRDGFRARGHNAWSCDLLPSSGSQSYHVQGDILDALEPGRGDMVIAFPPCTFLCNSGVRWLYNGDGSKNHDRWYKMSDDAWLFKRITEYDCDKIVCENSIPHRYAMAIMGRKYDQIVQPWMFGHPETKAICLWLKGVEPLEETNNVRERMMTLPKKQRNRVHYMSPGKDRGLLRSKTLPGVADAMAEQWG